MTARASAHRHPVPAADRGGVPARPRRARHTAAVAGLALLGALFGTVLAADVASAADAAPAEPAAVARIPRVKGLTTMRSVTEPQGDYESVSTFTAVDDRGIVIDYQGDLPDGPDGAPTSIRVKRRVPTADLEHAHALRNRYWPDDPETLPGTTPNVSSDVLNALRSGAEVAMQIDNGARMFGQVLEPPIDTKVARVGTGAEDFAVIVNGRRATVKVLQAKGTVPYGTRRYPFVLWILDDPANPLLLAAEAPTFTVRTLRIEFPQPTGAPDAIESRLAANQPVDVYGIFFGFNSAELKPASDRVLREVADLLARHRDWRLQLDGHTDGIGGAPFNLALSQKRALAVRTALVQRFGVASDRLASGGYGAGRPKGDNATPEGRALNRRVELRRL